MFGITYGNISIVYQQEGNIISFTATNGITGKLYLDRPKGDDWFVDGNVDGYSEQKRVKVLGILRQHFCKIG